MSDPLTPEQAKRIIESFHRFEHVTLSDIPHGSLYFVGRREDGSLILEVMEPDPTGRHIFDTGPRCPGCGGHP